MPSTNPTDHPSESPTDHPSAQPSVSPSANPTPSKAPSSSPTISLVSSPVIATTKIKPLKFYILEVFNYTSKFTNNNESIARTSSYYNSHRTLNEYCAEIWLHRGFQLLKHNNTIKHIQTLDPDDADVILIPGYAHLKAIDPSVYMKSITNKNKSKPHLLLIPTVNGEISRITGIQKLVIGLKEQLTNLWSVGFERNSDWQGLSHDRIIPIPYVVKLPVQTHLKNNNNASIVLPKASSSTTPAITESKATVSQQRINDFVFYIGSQRPNAVEWGKCNREQMIRPFQNSTNGNDQPNMFIQLVSRGTRVDQSTYNQYMSTSDYCLILCGDTPTSRSLTSAMVYGCIPIRVGSRLRGLCEPPCEAAGYCEPPCEAAGYGWQVSGEANPHLPFSDLIPWDDFPEVDEAEFIHDGKQVLKEALDRYGEKKNELRTIMEDVRDGWIYGWGDPVTSTDFGNVYEYILDSFSAALDKERVKN